MSQNNEMINIAFICDNNYAMPTGVVITSIEQNRDINNQYQIYVLCKQVDQSNIDRLSSYSKENFQVTVIELEDNNKFNNIEQKTEHVTFTALNKFNLPEIFPNLDKILYLDSDLLIMQDLKELYDTNIDDYYVGAVPDLAVMIRYNPPILQKLKVENETYFNSGVMLLNLDLMRKNAISKLLVNYRKYGINYFMDQDAFNVILGRKLKILPLKYNFLNQLLNRCNVWEISDFYNISISQIGENVIDDVCIIHLTSKLKPWKYDIYYFTDLFMKYFEKSKFSDVKIKLNSYPDDKKELALVDQNKRINDLFKDGLYKGEPREKMIIVSLTTFPLRINAVVNVIKTMISQTLKPDKIILWLTYEEYPNGEISLPESLLLLKNYGLEIMFNNNLKPHNKYFYTMKLYPDDIVITVDDDIVYPTTLIEDLYNGHIKFPNAVIARRVHYITYNKTGDFLQYTKWRGQNQGYNNIPLMGNLATGVGGVLYPPHCMHKELFNLPILKEFALNADDIWLKFMQILSNTPVVSISSNANKLEFIDDTQTVGLCYNNVHGGGNDRIIYDLLRYYKDFDDNKSIINNRLHNYDCNMTKCVICDNVFNGNAYIDGKCSYCNSTETARVIGLYLLYNTKIVTTAKQQKVLTINEEICYNHFFCKSELDIEYCSIDLDFTERQYEKFIDIENINLIILNLQNYINLNFDLFAKKMFEILRFNGMILIKIPEKTSYIDLKESLEKIEFEVQKIDYKKEFSPEEQRLLGLTSSFDATILKCSKKIAEKRIIRNEIKTKIKFDKNNLDISFIKEYNKINGQLRWARDELEKVRTERLEYKKDLYKLKGIKSTFSYNLGRTITWLPRKIRDIFIDKE